MTSFELFWLSLQPIMPPLYPRVRRELVRVTKACTRKPKILDVGGRKSHYTIGVPADIHITDLPRTTAVQQLLRLGLNTDIVRQTKLRRSNVRWVLFEDMTQSSLRDATFDCVVAVEVLEHVERDAEFVREVWRVLRPGGVFIMTTPNGDYLAPHNPDHKRHYRRQQLHDLLARHFEQVTVDYAIKGGRYRRWGLSAWSLRRPFRTVRSIVGGMMNRLESSHPAVREQARGTHHLFAIARKAL